MKLNPYILFLSLLVFGIINQAFSQTDNYIQNGSAIKESCNCYSLTGESENQKGSVWNKTKIDLYNSFAFTFNVNLGCNDKDGADGMVFILQPLSTNIGLPGEGMGFEGISPSVGIPLNTYQNLNRNDPPYDNISIQLNGVITHGNDLAGPVRISDTSDNVEDCKWHLLKISWDAATHKISAYFDNVLRVEANINLIDSVFNKDPFVYWGFSAATGGSYNVQKFCTILKPDFNAQFKNSESCIGSNFSVINQSDSSAPIKNYYWDFGDGTVCTLPDPPSHTYLKADNYKMRLAITGFDGCNSDTITKTIPVGDVPVPSFSVFDTCAKSPPRISDNSTVQSGTIRKWQWVLDNTAVSESQFPQLSGLAPGNHQLQLSVESTFGCVSGIVSRNFNLSPLPVVDFLVQDYCINEPVKLKGIQVDNLSIIKKWSWQLDKGQTGSSQEITHSFSTPGQNIIQLRATNEAGCISDPAIKNILINKINAFAGNDTIIIQDTYFQLKGAIAQYGNDSITVKWSPANGLEDNTSLVTKGIIPDNQLYTLTTTTKEGCTAQDDVQVIIFKGSAAYVPSAFTPNHDGKNEILKPYLVGIKQVNYFTIYNRWGQLVFTTTTQGEGWDGTIRGIDQPLGIYVWMLKAVDLMGNVYNKKGTTTLIR